MKLATTVLSPTISTLNAFTQQQVFDFVVTHLMTQGKKSDDEDGDCRYRTPEGLKCAVGCLMSDEEYNPKYEGCSVPYLQMVFREDSFLNLIATYEKLLTELQYVHDTYTPEAWSEQLQEVADTFKLEMPKTTELLIAV